jgi:hypothetical protein
MLTKFDSSSCTCSHAILAGDTRVIVDVGINDVWVRVDGDGTVRGGGGVVTFTDFDLTNGISPSVRMVTSPLPWLCTSVVSRSCVFASARPSHLTNIGNRIFTPPKVLKHMAKALPRFSIRKLCETSSGVKRSI